MKSEMRSEVRLEGDPPEQKSTELASIIKNDIPLANVGQDYQKIDGPHISHYEIWMDSRLVCDRIGWPENARYDERTNEIRLGEDGYVPTLKEANAIWKDHFREWLMDRGCQLTRGFSDDGRLTQWFGFRADGGAIFDHEIELTCLIECAGRIRQEELERDNPTQAAFDEINHQFKIIADPSTKLVR